MIYTPFDRTILKLLYGKAFRAPNAYELYNHLTVVPDGAEGMAFLRRGDGYAGSPRPDLILLDLNLPKKDGREVLAEIKRDEHLRNIPMVILATSTSETDISNTYNLHANCYVTKRADLNQFIDVIRTIGDFLLTIARLPS